LYRGPSVRRCRRINPCIGRTGKVPRPADSQNGADSTTVGIQLLFLTAMNFKRVIGVAISIVLTASAAFAAKVPLPVERPSLAAIAAAPQVGRLSADLVALVGFGTRHTLSDTTLPTRGIGAARRWTQAQFQKISADCGQCLDVQMPSSTVSGNRIPVPTELADVIAIQRGTIDPNRVILIMGHIDSRVTDVMNATADAPGANDDGSGTVLTLEAARILSQYKFPATIVYALLSGEEQGLYGGKLLAQYAKDHGWIIEGALNNDIVGSTRGGNGVRNNALIRLFSESTRGPETPEQARKRRVIGGELDSPSRNLARYIKQVVEPLMPNWTIKLVYRLDRYGRGGDHSAFNDLGDPAVRFTEAAEDYAHQHQDLRTENGVIYGDTIDHVDFDYLARVTATNAIAAASLALAPAPPARLEIKGAVSTDTILSWQPPAGGAASYRVYWRDSTEPTWTHSRDVGTATEITLKDVVVDDWVFGVASRNADGDESPVEFAGEPGAFPTAP
jgi:hypothetical protein